MATAGSPSTTYSHIRVSVHKGTGFSDFGEFFISVSLGEGGERRETKKARKGGADRSLNWAGESLDFARPTGNSHAPKLYVKAHQHTYSGKGGSEIGAIQLDAIPQIIQNHQLLPRASRLVLGLSISYVNLPADPKFSSPFLFERPRNKSGETGSGGGAKRPVASGAVGNGRPIIPAGRLGVDTGRQGGPNQTSDEILGGQWADATGHLSLIDRTHLFCPNLYSSPFTRIPANLREYPHDPPTDSLNATARQPVSAEVPSIMLNDEEPQYGNLSIAAGVDDPGVFDRAYYDEENAPDDEAALIEAAAVDATVDATYYSPEGLGMRAVPDLVDASTLLPFQSPDGNDESEATAYISFAP